MADSNPASITRSRLLAFTGALLYTNLKATLMLRGAFVMQVVFMALNNVTFFVFWWVLMRRVPDIHGWQLPHIQVLFGIVASSFGLAVTTAGGVRQLGRLIDEGELDTLLTKPKPVLLHALGLRSQASGFGDLLSGLALIVSSGLVTWSAVPALAVAVAASAMVFVATGVVFHGLGFWLGRVETVARQMWDLMITFAIYPEPLFGGALRLVLFTLLPAGFIGYLPARIAMQPSAGELAALVVGAGLYLTVAVLVFGAGLKRYASGSRFGTFG
jgi:ABC-2 type transport system permease protein